jgi:lariat debranching enzyme
MEIATSDLVTFAVEGCCHGDLDQIYGVLEDAEVERAVKTDFLLCCGDFQAVRTHEELECMACPAKYRAMKDFVHYWEGKRKPYCPTLFIGGNHESPVHLRDLYFGGWASDDILYLGHSGIVNIGGLRLAGLSGIYKSNDVYKGHFETFPYSEDSKRSAYHVRKFEVNKLLAASGPIDVFISHDWPTGITDHGDVAKLLKIDKTGQLTEDIRTGTLGNPLGMEILKALKPKYWFSGHMHMHFTALVHHPDGSVTRFMALDKCQPRRQFLHFFSLVEDGMMQSETVYGDRNAIASEKKSLPVCFDIEWLAILKKNNDRIPLESQYYSEADLEVLQPSEEDKQEVIRLLREDGTAKETSLGMFEIPKFGKSQPGDAEQRNWLSKALKMEDRLSTKESGAIFPQAVIASVADDDGLFFEDSFSLESKKQRTL